MLRPSGSALKTELFDSIRQPPKVRCFFVFFYTDMLSFAEDSSPVNEAFFGIKNDSSWGGFILCSPAHVIDKLDPAKALQMYISRKRSQWASAASICFSLCTHQVRGLSLSDGKPYYFNRFGWAWDFCCCSTQLEQIMLWRPRSACILCKKKKNTLDLIKMQSR